MTCILKQSWPQQSIWRLIPRQNPSQLSPSCQCWLYLTSNSPSSSIIGLILPTVKLLRLEILIGGCAVSSLSLHTRHDVSVVIENCCMQFSALHKLASFEAQPVKFSMHPSWPQIEENSQWGLATIPASDSSFFKITQHWISADHYIFKLLFNCCRTNCIAIA